MQSYFGQRNFSMSRQTTIHCETDEITMMLRVNSSQISVQIALTLSAVALFVGTRTIVEKIRRTLAHITVVVIGAGPIGLTSALIAVHCKKVKKLVLYEEETKFAIGNKSYQIAINPSSVAFLRKYGIDFDNLEGLWHEGCFYTRVGIYLEYIINVLPLQNTDVEFKFRTKFNTENSNEIDHLAGRKLVICCDGSTGQAARALGISDECVYHSSSVYGAVAAIERQKQTLVPIPERRVHNLTFDLSAYGGPIPYEELGQSKFSMKIFGNSRCRYMALSVNKCESSVVRTLRTILDKSLMRNIFLKCFNTYKSPEETGISDSYCLNNMKFSPRLCEIKLSQRMETVAYFADCDIFVITEGEASRSYNFNTGLDVNVGLKGLAALEPFIGRIVCAESEHSIMSCLLYKMEHSEKECKSFLKHGLKEYIFM